MTAIFSHHIHDIHSMFEKVFYKLFIELAQIYAIGGGLGKEENISEFKIFIFSKMSFFKSEGLLSKNKNLYGLKE